MARFDVYRTASGFAVDVQTDLLYQLNTRLLVPLVPLASAPMPAGRLNPVLEIDGELYSLQPQLMAAVPDRELRRPVDNLLRHYDRIVAAIDMIFNGF
jgi:toxin CcdB